ncbi:MAG: Fe-S cluster assembly protein SufD, partial [Bacteroidota bacterium]
TVSFKGEFRLVFINGQYNHTLSSAYDDAPEGMTILPTGAALQHDDYKELANELLSNWQTEAGKTLVKLNDAFAAGGVFIHVARNAVIERPIQFLYLQHATNQPFFFNPQILLSTETSSSSTIVETYYNHQSVAGTPYWGNAAVRIKVGANSQVKHYKFQTESQDAFQTTNTEVTQERDSTYSGYTFDLGGRLVRNNLSVWLKDQATHTDMYGVYLGNNQQHIDNQTFIDHAYPNCDSNELYKGILTDKAVGVFNGKVMVRQDAQKTNAFQQNSSLVLSDSAKMDTKPQLEIFADDVKCSHGATIGQLEEDSIYYLQTRGLSEERAKSLLQVAFLSEVLEAVKLKDLHEQIENAISTKLA